MHISRYIPSWVFDILACMGGCLGCFTKPSPIIVINDPPKGRIIQGGPVNRSSFPEDLWSSSLEDFGPQYQSPNCTSSTSTSNPHEFVNHGLLLWNDTRQQWLGNKKSVNTTATTPIGEPRISCNSTYESLLGSKKPFPQPIPLSEMIDFLVDIWEQDGLYD